MENLKDKATNIAAVLGIISGIILSCVTGGVALPPAVITLGVVFGSASLGIANWFTGKNPDGTKKSQDQIDATKKA